MKILIYTEINDNYGTGNVLRMAYLYSYLVKFENFKVNFATNNSSQAKNIIEKNSSISLKSLEIKESLRRKDYDTIVIDSNFIDEDLLKDFRTHTDKLMAFDYFNYDDNVIDIIINLYNHNKHKIHDFQGKIYEGVDYAILKEDIFDNKKNSGYIPGRPPEMLITFGGEDPNSNTKRVLMKLSFYDYNVTAIIGTINNDKEIIEKKWGNRYNIIEQVKNIGQYISDSDIIICGGGTTLLESIYMGNPVIAMPQNKLETKFINNIKKYIKIFKLSDLLDNKIKVDDRNFRKNIFESYSKYIDGKGKSRIKKIIKE